MKEEIKGIKNKDLDDFFYSDNEGEENLNSENQTSPKQRLSPEKGKVLDFIDEYVMQISELFPDEKGRGKRERQIRAILERMKS